MLPQKNERKIIHPGYKENNNVSSLRVSSKEKDRKIQHLKQIIKKIQHLKQIINVFTRKSHFLT